MLDIAGSPDALLRCVDRYGEELEHELHRRVAQHAAEFDRAVGRLEQIHSHLVARAHQAAWLRSFPTGAQDPGPVMCRLPSGHLVAVPLLLGPLHELELDARPLTNGAHDRRRGHDRRGKSPAMQLLADAGLSTRILAAEIDVSKHTPWSWLNGHTKTVPPELGLAIERLTGDPELAREIVELIPSRNGHG